MYSVFLNILSIIGFSHLLLITFVGTSHNPTGKPIPSDRQSNSQSLLLQTDSLTPKGIWQSTDISTVPASQSAFTTAALTQLERPLDSAPPTDI
jgi:hypothetical protein